MRQAAGTKLRLREEDVIGRAWLRYRPLSRWGPTPGHEWELVESPDVAFL